MKVGGKVIFLCRDARGYGPAIFGALHPSPNSSLQTSYSLSHSPTATLFLAKESFDLSLEKYGIKDTKASGDIVNFVDSQGLSQVSVILLQNYEPPFAVCAVNEVLASIMVEKSSDVPTLILPSFVSAQKVNREMANSTQTNQKGPVYGAQIGFKTDFTEALTGGIQEAPPSLQVSCEPLAGLLQLVHVLKLPTVVLIGSIGQQQAGRTEDQEIEVLHELGELLASRLRLHFSGDTICWDTKDRSQDIQESWRALYG
ncbi:hypothetical protein ACLOJK_041666 [Asimina triloba]